MAARSPRRSSRWPKARKAHLKAHPRCAACGGTDKLEVHHVRPYHLFPALELVGTNLITLCEAPARNCHLMFGHALSWKCFNPNVRRDAATFATRVAKRKGGS
jgi:5-methylcytosine-specific restriction protein A